MPGVRQLRSLALALCLCNVSAFAGVISGSRGAANSAVRDCARANAAMSPRVFDEVDQLDAGVLRRARGGAIFRRRAAEVSLPEGGEVVVESPLIEKRGGGGGGVGGGLLASYLRALDRKPITTKVITSGVICGAGDIMAQALAFKAAALEKVTLGGFLASLQFNRFAIYTLIGAFWIAPVVHYWFDALEATFKDKKVAAGGPKPSFSANMFKALKMVTVDQTIGAPLVNAGVLFLFPFGMALANGSGGVSAAKKAASIAKGSLWGTMCVCWKLWPMANMINFAFVPAKLRVLFLNFVGLGWNIYLAGAVN